MNTLLKMLSWLYGIGVGLRNMLFDMGILESRSYDIPIISLGNITAGGTGKTPHAEYLIRLLSPHYRVAVLSRGYRRRSKGYVLATADTPIDQIGDEPWQMKHKFPEVYVAVDANRRRGIDRLMTDEATRDVQVILLDDAYQHRYVKPSLNILLVDNNRLITNDHLLPAGFLREPVSGKVRADMMIVTKCPAQLTPIGYQIAEHALEPRPYQDLFYSTMQYGDLTPVFAQTPPRALTTLADQHILLIAGIASPLQMGYDLRPYCPDIKLLAYPDHHYFSPKDVEQINDVFATLPQPRLAITTEKDVARLLVTPGLNEELRQQLHQLPIEARLLRDDKTFNLKILTHVHENSKIRSMA
ncbi:MAG: tetraacyldisaccharide 4'-kinase [Bacteroidaceae bacterium]|nr:tetraacyldisaccharide 4'-kinase [Bacteroidaceae bacterium]